MTHDEMANELRRAGWRVSAPINQDTCPHHNQIGHGMIGSDGSSESSGYCRDCGKSWHYETKGDPSRLIVQQLFNGWSG